MSMQSGQAASWCSQNLKLRQRLEAFRWLQGMGPISGPHFGAQVWAMPHPDLRQAERMCQQPDVLQPWGNHAPLTLSAQLFTRP